MAQLMNWPWRAWAEQAPERTALLDGARAVSWRALSDEITRRAAGFAFQGVRPSDTVALRGKNSTDVLLTYLAVLQCGARVLPLNPQLPASLLTELLPDLNVTHGYCTEVGYAWPVPLTLLSAQADGAAELPEWRAERLATLTLTSGSSGMPKAAAHSFHAHLSSARGVLAMMTFTAEDTWLLSLPLFHVSGQGIIWRWLLAGGVLALRDMHPLDEALRGCTHASLVPTQLWRLLGHSGDALSLKAVLLGGAMIPVDLVELAEARGIRCWCGYGLTEMASTVCAKRADALPGVGLPLPGREMKLVNGEIFLRGENMASGYWRDGHLIPISDSDGWFATRDRGVMEAGELRIVGRMDNLFFSGGEGIQPEDIERVLMQHPQVTQVFVVPVADEEFGQRPVAVVEGNVEVGELAGWLSGRVARFQMPVRWFVLPEVLKGGGIKVSRRLVGEWVKGEC